MKFIDLLNEAKKICGDRRVYSRDNTAFLVDGIIGFGDRHNIWFRDKDKKIHIFAKNIAFENMLIILRGLYGGPIKEFDMNNEEKVKSKPYQMDLFKNENNIPEDDYGNYTFEEFEKYHKESELYI